MDQDRLRNFALDLDDRVHGTTNISLDWGNVSIECGSVEVKEAVRALAQDYLMKCEQLKQSERELEIYRERADQYYRKLHPGIGPDTLMA